MPTLTHVHSRKSWLLLLIVCSIGVAYPQVPEKPTKAWLKKCQPKLLTKPFPSLKGPFHFARGEKYRHAPAVSFSIDADGTVHDVKLTQRSGVRDIDQHALQDVSNWKYTSRPGCPTMETEFAILIHWAPN
jgi:TonB family protein